MKHNQLQSTPVQTKKNHISKSFMSQQLNMQRIAEVIYNNGSRERQCFHCKNIILEDIRTFYNGHDVYLQQPTCESCANLHEGKFVSLIYCGYITFYTLIQNCRKHGLVNLTPEILELEMELTDIASVLDDTPPPPPSLPFTQLPPPRLSTPHIQLPPTSPILGQPQETFLELLPDWIPKSELPTIESELPKPKSNKPKPKSTKPKRMKPKSTKPKTNKPKTNKINNNNACKKRTNNNVCNETTKKRKLVARLQSTTGATMQPKSHETCKMCRNEKGINELFVLLPNIFNTSTGGVCGECLQQKDIDPKTLPKLSDLLPNLLTKQEYDMRYII